MSPRLLIAVVASLLAGLLLGRVGPQADLRRANQRIDEMQKELRTQGRSGAGASLSGVKSMFKVSPQDMEAGLKARRARAAQQAATGTVATAVASGTSASNTLAQVAPAPAGHASLSNQVEKLKKAWTLRADIARTNFVARTKLDEAQVRDFDVLVEAMNIRLGTAIDQWAARIKQQGAMTPELGVRMMTDLGQAMVVTYDEMDRKLPEDWRQNAGEHFELVSLVDPEVLTPLQDLEGLVEPPDARGHGHHGGPPDLSGP